MRVWAAIVACILAGHAVAQSRGEHLIREQEQRLKVSCKALHPRAHQFLKDHVPDLLGGTTAQGLDFTLREAAELRNQTQKCYGIEPIARHTGVAFPADFGELQRVLDAVHDLAESVLSKKPAALQDRDRRELRERYDALKSGVGKRLPAGR